MKQLTAEDFKISTINKLKNQYALSPEEHAQLRALIDKILDQQTDELRKEIKELKNWKTGMIDVWMPVHSHIINKNVLDIGNSISKEVLRRLEELDTLKNENNCTFCGGQGYTSEHNDLSLDHEGRHDCSQCPIQAQCEHCLATGNKWTKLEQVSEQMAKALNGMISFYRPTLDGKYEEEQEKYLNESRKAFEAFNNLNK